MATATPHRRPTGRGLAGRSGTRRHAYPPGVRDPYPSHGPVACPGRSRQPAPGTVRSPHVPLRPLPSRSHRSTRAGPPPGHDHFDLARAVVPGNRFTPPKKHNSACKVASSGRDGHAGRNLCRLPGTPHEAVAGVGDTTGPPHAGAPLPGVMPDIRPVGQVTFRPVTYKRQRMTLRPSPTVRPSPISADFHTANRAFG